MTIFIRVLLVSLGISHALSWQALPEIPSGRRSQYFVLQEDGGYKYGYDTGDSSAAKQSADSLNQVTGHYFYKTPTGQNVDLKYTAGTQGFVPEGLEKIQQSPSERLPTITQQYSTNSLANDVNFGDESSSGDASYSFGYNTGDIQREETSDPKGNVKGSYSYSNEAGIHNLNYIAGENTGFVAVSGSLSKANGLKNNPRLSYLPPSTKLTQSPQVLSSLPSSDGSYSFGYTTNDQSRQESSDSNGNVQGSYSYRNLDGNHDLSYVAGASTGFLVTGGSLAKIPNLVSPQNLPANPNAEVFSSISSPSSDLSNSGDASYKFSIDTDDYKREESSDANGYVVGKFSYKNEAGNHDLSYVAGAETGFLPTGGSLSDPNAITAKIVALPQIKQIAPSTFNKIETSYPEIGDKSDGSYSFTIDTDQYNRYENADSNGNVRGSYSYKNLAGIHDLSFVAGAETGFQPISGSLVAAPGVKVSQIKNFESIPSTKTSYKLDQNVVLNSYLPPSNEMKKFGYVFDTL